MQRIPARVARGLIIVIATLLLLEAGVRLFLPRYDPSGQIELAPGEGARPPLGVPLSSGRQRKNTGDYDVLVRFNRLGFRDDKDLADAGPSALIVVGDSFSFGWGVSEEQRYSDLLQQHLGRPVYNIAAPGGHLESYAALVQYAAENGARIGHLVVGLCMENDLHSYRPMPTAQRTGGIGTVKSTLGRYSATYVALTTLVHHNSRLRNLAIDLGLLVPNLEGIHDSRYSPEIIHASVNQLSKLTEGFRTTVLVIPSRALWTGDDRAEAGRVHDALLRALDGKRIRYVDLRPVFEASGNPMQFHFTNDGHWNEQGHRVAARALARELGH